MHTTASPVETAAAPRGLPLRVVAFFPGLGSRGAYRGEDDALVRHVSPSVRSVYTEAAAALGFPETPERLLLRQENLPEGRLARQGFLGAAMTAHNLALFRTLAHPEAANARVVATTGESLGMLAAACAAGSVEVGTAVRFAYAFTPIMLTAAEGLMPDAVHPADRDLVTLARTYLGSEQTALVGEPLLVLGVTAAAGTLDQMRRAIAETFVPREVELHKCYSPTQLNYYATVEALPKLERLVSCFRDASLAELKPATTFAAHSHRLAPVRRAFEALLDHETNELRDPQVPILANHQRGVLTTASEVREALLAMTDQPMVSSDTAAEAFDTGADAILEVGLGGKSVALLEDNQCGVVAVSYIGSETLAALKSVAQVDDDLARVRRGEVVVGELDHLQGMFRATAQVPAMRRGLERHAVDRGASHDLLDAYRATELHGSRVDLGAGELVLRAVVKKQVELPEPWTETVAAELLVRRPDGTTELRTVPLDWWPEATVLLFTGHRALGDEVALAEQLEHSRPALVEGQDVFVAASSARGWLAALVHTHAMSLDAAQQVMSLMEAGADLAAITQVVRSVVSVPRHSLVGGHGSPISTVDEIVEETAKRAGAGPATGLEFHLDGHCQVLSFGAPPEVMTTGVHRVAVTRIDSLAQARRDMPYAPLDDVERVALFTHDSERELVAPVARARRMLCTRIHAYVHAPERILGFGKGGSESLTIFLCDGSRDIFVRKILSEAMTTVRWDPNGRGVMLPPFAKARKQAEYLQALPERVKPFFPEVYSILDRELPVPSHLRESGQSVYRELIYEMSYMRGEEISRFVEKYCPPPAVVARLYEQVFRLLHMRLHSVQARRAPAETVNAAYLRKIEERLALSQQTAPYTFGDHLLRSERIVINGHEMFNAGSVIRQLRQRADWMQLLEPSLHTLVMGDTNTENIKIGNIAPLLHAQNVIEAQADRGDIDAALDDITPMSLGITFLDPRAIGFNSDGAGTVDDPMYDNKPWHNSIGHYDEIDSAPRCGGVWVGGSVPTHRGPGRLRWVHLA